MMETIFTMRKMAYLEMRRIYLSGPERLVAFPESLKKKMY